MIPQTIDCFKNITIQIALKIYISIRKFIFEAQKNTDGKVLNEIAQKK